MHTSNTTKATVGLKSGQPISVGVLFSATGHLSIVEQSSIQAALFAIDEINKNGGIAGFNIKPIVIDAQSELQGYTRGINQLITSHQVFCTFGGYTSASRRAILPTIIARQHLVYLPACWEGKECTQNTIHTGPVTNQHAANLIPYMMQRFGSRVYFIGSNYVWPKETNKLARLWVEENQGQVVGETYFPLGWRDFNSVFNDLESSQPDFIFSTIVGDSTTAFYQHFKQLGYRAAQLPIASLTTSEIEIRHMGLEAGEGHFLAAPYFQSLETKTNQQFVSRFLNSQYGSTKVTHYNMVNTYLAVYAFKLALEKAIEKYPLGVITPKLIRHLSAGLEIPENISPQGKVWIDPDNFGTAFIPKIGQAQANGQFEIVHTAADHIAPIPYAAYPEKGICYIDGLHTPDAKIIPNAL